MVDRAGNTVLGISCVFQNCWAAHEGVLSTKDLEDALRLVNRYYQTSWVLLSTNLTAIDCLQRTTRQVMSCMGWYMQLSLHGQSKPSPLHSPTAILALFERIHEANEEDHAVKQPSPFVSDKIDESDSAACLLSDYVILHMSNASILWKETFNLLEWVIDIGSNALDSLLTNLTSVHSSPQIGWIA